MIVWASRFNEQFGEKDAAKKAGVPMLDLEAAQKIQGDLLHAPDVGRSKAKIVAIDALNARFGGDTAFATTLRKRDRVCGTTT